MLTASIVKATARTLATFLACISLHQNFSTTEQERFSYIERSDSYVSQAHHVCCSCWQNVKNSKKIIQMFPNKCYHGAGRKPGGPIQTQRSYSWRGFSTECYILTSLPPDPSSNYSEVRNNGFIQKLSRLLSPRKEIPGSWKCVMIGKCWGSIAIQWFKPSSQDLSTPNGRGKNGSPTQLTWAYPHRPSSSSLSLSWPQTNTWRTLFIAGTILATAKFSTKLVPMKFPPDFLNYLLLPFWSGRPYIFSRWNVLLLMTFQHSHPNIYRADQGHIDPTRRGHATPMLPT